MAVVKDTWSVNCISWCLPYFDPPSFKTHVLCSVGKVYNLECENGFTSSVGNHHVSSRRNSR